MAICPRIASFPGPDGARARPGNKEPHMTDLAETCRVAVIGAGYMAAEHLRAFAALPSVRLAGIHSRSRDKADALARRFGIGCVAASPEELYEKARPHLVVLAVNAVAVGDMAVACGRFPWTILAEKPVGVDHHAARAVVSALGEAGNRVFVALNRRFYSATARVQADLADNPSPRFIEAFDQQEPEKLLALGKNPVEVENLMFTNSIHVIDYLSMFGRGDPIAVLPLAETERHPLAVVAAVRFSSGDLGVYHGLWNAPGPWAATITTASRRWEMRPLEVAASQDAGSRTLNRFEPDAVDREYKPGLLRQAEEAVRAAMGLASTSVPLAEACRTMELAARIYAREGPA